MCGEFRKDERFQPIVDGLGQGLRSMDVQIQVSAPAVALRVLVYSRIIIKKRKL